MLELPEPERPQDRVPELGYVFSTYAWDYDSPESIRQFMSKRNISYVVEMFERDGSPVRRFFVPWKYLYLADMEIPGTILIFESEPTMRGKYLTQFLAYFKN